MRNRIYCYMPILIITSVIICFSGCEEKKPELPPKYEGWESYSYKHFVYHFHPDNFWGRNIDRFSTAFERYLEEDCEFLAMEIPTDTIHFYIHTDMNSGVELTGRDLPYHTDNQIHWGRQSPFGLELARYLINKIDMRMTDYKVLYDGLATLLDYSNKDYHRQTASLTELKRYIPLDTLIDNDAYGRANERERVWEAASLVAYIKYHYGINRFKLLWQSTSSFEQSVQDLFQVDMLTFEKEWNEFTRQYFDGLNIQDIPVKEVLGQDSTKQ